MSLQIVGRTQSSLTINNPAFALSSTLLMIGSGVTQFAVENFHNQNVRSAQGGSDGSAAGFLQELKSVPGNPVRLLLCAGIIR